MVLGDVSNQLRCSESVAAELVASSSDAIRRKINRKRLKDKCADQLPTCPEDFLNVPDEYAQINGQPFLQHAELVDGKPMLVFFSQNGVSQLNNSSVWASDGNFSFVPDQFAQLYVIFASKDEHVFPAVYAFLPSKSAHVYEKMFECVLSAVSTAPQKLVVDFERAVINTVESQIEGIVVEGCLFHWKKAIFSHMQKIGLLRLFNQDENMQSAMQLIYSLAYVPAEQIVDIFENRVKTQIDEFCKQWGDENADLVKKLLLYVEKYWIGEKVSIVCFLLMEEV